MRSALLWLLGLWPHIPHTFRKCLRPCGCPHLGHTGHHAIALLGSPSLSGPTYVSPLPIRSAPKRGCRAQYIESSSRWQRQPPLHFAIMASPLRLRAASATSAASCSADRAASRSTSFCSRCSRARAAAASSASSSASSLASSRSRTTAQMRNSLSSNSSIRYSGSRRAFLERAVLSRPTGHTRAYNSSTAAYISARAGRSRLFEVSEVRK